MVIFMVEEIFIPFDPAASNRVKGPVRLFKFVVVSKETTDIILKGLVESQYQYRGMGQVRNILRSRNLDPHDFVIVTRIQNPLKGVKEI